jgi:prepilin-type processing-associated H-X9-DG protein
MYSSEWPGLLPAPSGGAGSDNALQEGKCDGMGQLTAYIAGDVEKAPFGRKPGLVICPDEKNPWHQIDSYDPRWISYTLHGPSWWAGAPQREGDPKYRRVRAVRVDRIRRKDQPIVPSDVIQFAEAKDTGSAGWGTGYYKGAPLDHPHNGTYGTLINQNWMFRHGKDWRGMNVVYWDGHVSFVPDWTAFDPADSSWAYWN